MKKSLRIALVTTLLLVLCLIPITAGSQKEEGSTTESSQTMTTGGTGRYSHYNLDGYSKRITSFNESPMLKSRVASGELPPVDERLPDNPLVMDTWEEIGKYGGTLQLVSLSAETRRINSWPMLEFVYEAGFGREGKRLGAELRPGVVESWTMNDNGTEYTFTIRKGLKWSDGVPVTTEDVRFFFEDVMMNKELTPNIPRWYNWRGTPAELTIIDESTWKIKFGAPYGAYLWEIDTFYLEQNYLIRPSHYDKTLHKKYTSMDKLLPLMKEQGYTKEDEWAPFFLSVSSCGFHYMHTEGRPTWDEIPTLGPYLLVQSEEDIARTWERNPYYYKIDSEGNQLPYIDTIQQDMVGDLEAVNLKIIAGQVDYVAESLVLESVPLYQENKAKGGYEVMLLPYWRGYPNMIVLNYYIEEDPILTDLLMDLRFREALSISLNRDEVRQALYLGMGASVQHSSPPPSPWYDPAYENAAAEYDPEKANALLDEMGLKWDSNKQYRLRPDGERLTLVCEYNTPFSAEAELIQSYWREIGVNLDLKFLDSSVFGPLYSSGKVQLTLRWSNEPEPTDNGYFAHPARITGNTWGLWINSGGANGVEPPEWVKQVYVDRDTLFSTPDDAERIAAGRRIGAAHAKYLWNIGMAGQMPVPVVYNKNLGNIAPAKDADIYSMPVMEAAAQWFFRE